ncbi:pyridoxamine 5'-phosphate oxidase [Caulobacter sp. S45]|uniref:pyridoxamine 5'-phosphate oxidase n=1 Tax=Caulobacter sp. S45 TaxID=1641861 RepID=UPI00157693CB|nr:pyridoxamine 5'-phosphate oxidase [Caulobacter sp. S45]
MDPAEEVDEGLFEGDDPLGLFDRWLRAAEASEPNDPNGMAVATVDDRGLPDVRMVLLKDWDARGFVFYTNVQSDKGRQLEADPKAALLFHWKSLRRQVRIRGTVEAVTEAESDAYYASRPRGSQVGAWASDQSRPLPSRAELEARVQAVDDEYGGETPPRPPFWRGYRVQPLSFEFWRDRRSRLHDRMVFRREGLSASWTTLRLYP